MPKLAPLPLLAPNQSFPALDQAWAQDSPAPGLLATGGVLNVATLIQAYSQAIFPWFGQDEPILWWSPDPRLVLPVERFRLHRSLRKTLNRFRQDQHCSVRMNSAFVQVMESCARVPRAGQHATWIGPSMIEAYTQLHQAGLAHSVETWVDDQLVAGLYCVAIGGAVFGESMFSLQSDGSKLALAALVSFCRVHGLPTIDCQQNTAHLRSLGATEVARKDFALSVQEQVQRPAPNWRFDPVYWDALLEPPAPLR